jgi:Uncharacterized protein conserved in archaea (DUF2226)
MELPITKPSMVSYADELNFSQLADELTNKQHNGFIRVTADSEEGFILYKNGKQVAASYDRFSKSEALEKIEFALAENNTLIEVFDVRPSQVDYLLELNQPYVIKDESKVPDVISELKETETAKKPISMPNSEPVSEPDSIQKVTVETETVAEDTKTDTEITNLPEEQPEDVNISNSSLDTVEKVKPESELVKTISETPDKNTVVTHELTSETTSDTTEKSIETAVTPDPSPKSTSKMHEVDEGLIEIISSQSKVDESREISSKIEEEPQEEPLVDRSELLKKYGIKDVDEKEVENLLESYKGGSISDDDAEKIELTLMNRIKKSVLGIPKIQGTEVMVFLDNYRDLSGTINIITAYESDGFFSRMMGQSKTVDNLKRQIINIAEIEIKKSFRQYPEVIDEFDINVEFS